jgi:pimeloyl-ACP methyl ester carboxylesterase
MAIILVHGAWSGGWSWRDAARLLRAKGYDVYAPTLTGLAERSHVPPEQVGLSSHIDEIAGLMRYEDLTDVLLVGHSYAGMVVTGAADRERRRLAGLMYIDAFLPESGQSLWDIAGPEGKAKQQAMAEAYDGGKSVPRPPHAPPPDAGLAAKWAAMFTPQSTRTFSEPYVSVRGAATMDATAWPPRHYALCAAYKGSVFHGLAAKVNGRAGWTSSEFDAQHDVVRTDPQDVADRIEGFAREVGAARLFA